MQQQAKMVGRAKGGEHGCKQPIAGLRKNPANAPPTLAEAGIDKHLAKRARKLVAAIRRAMTGYVAYPVVRLR